MFDAARFTPAELRAIAVGCGDMCGELSGFGSARDLGLPEPDCDRSIEAIELRAHAAAAFTRALRLLNPPTDPTPA